MPRPAPVTTATRPSKLCMSTPSPPSGAAAFGCGLVGRRRRGKRGLEAQQVTEGPADHGGPLVVGHAGEQLGHELLAAAERSLCVWVVVAPDDRRQTGDVPAGHGDRVVLERNA